MASSLARLGAALPRARPRAAARALPPGRWDAAALGASRRAALNGKSKALTNFAVSDEGGGIEWIVVQCLLMNCLVTKPDASMFDRTL